MAATSGPLQDPAELEAFVRVVKSEGVRSYLEIGSKFGGSLDAIVHAMPVGARAVAVDLGASNDLKSVVSRLKIDLYDIHLVLGDSVDSRTVEKVRALGPYDLVLIDANHHESYVRKDWFNYGPMGRVVAFHDIAYDLGDRQPKPWKIEVPKVWNEIKNGYRYLEIKLCNTGRDNGIGILWREASAGSLGDVAAAVHAGIATVHAGGS